MRNLLPSFITAISAVLLVFTGCMDVPSTPPDLKPVGNIVPSGLNEDPVINRFSVTPAAITVGSKAVLSWDVSNASSVSLNQGIGLVEAKGSLEVSPISQTAYILTATNQKGATFAKVTLSIQAQGEEKLPVVLEFTTDPAVPKRGQSARLRWTTRGATQVMIDNVPVQPNGDKMIRLDGPTTYMITVTNSFGSDIRYLSVQVE